MSWTDERIELLKKLWAEGLSASQIAAELTGVTRNAVIGKVHRLGLSGRAKAGPAAAQRTRGKAQAAAPAMVAAPIRSGGASVAPQPVVQAIARGATALKQEMVAIADPAAQAIVAPGEVVVPMSRRVSIMELREGVCRWPIGDPTQADFVYCGADCSVGAPYCGFHSKVAYQPSDRRARPDFRR